MSGSSLEFSPGRRYIFHINFDRNRKRERLNSAFSSVSSNFSTERNFFPEWNFTGAHRRGRETLNRSDRSVVIQGLVDDDIRKRPIVQ